MTAACAEFEGPGSTRGVYAWLHSRIPFESLNTDQRRARSELRSRLSRLVAKEGEVLQASYAGPRHPGSDVENLLLYNVDMNGACFRRCATHGVRFEVASGGLREPALRAGFSCAYAYRLVPANRDFEHWKVRRELARFDGVSVPAAPGSLLGRTWLALHGAEPDLAPKPIEPAIPFAVRLTVHGADAPVSSPTVVKSLIDGTVAAFQAHGDPLTRDEIAYRIADSLGVGRRDAAHLLTRPERAVLGVRPRLAWPWRDGVQWNPGDDFCLAGEVLAAAGSEQWVLSGRVVEIERC